jgi:tetratricopeptide (TPR) repeat protein
MQTVQELIAKYTNGENIPTLDDLFDRLSLNGTPEEKELITDGYISDFGQCHYDYMCGKFNDLEWIWELMDWIEKIKILNPDFDQYYFFKGHVYEMLSSVSKKQKSKIKFNNLCIDHLRKQQEVNSEDVTLLIDLAQNIFLHCRLIRDYKTQILDEVKALFLKALHLERKEEHQSDFFGFNGSAISGFLNISYDFLGLSFDNSANVHQEFISAFKEAIKPYAKEDPSIYYHWAETLLRITSWVDYPKIDTCRISQEVVDDIWKEVKEVLNLATDVRSDNEHFLTSIGHLFNRIAEKEVSFFYFEIAFNYYSKALEINGETWSNPYYASSALRMMAFIRLKNNEREESVKLFDQGLRIFEEAQKKISDFQLSVYHGDYLYDYAEYLEGFSNRDTLLEAKKQFEDSRILAKDFYTHPYYGLAKTVLRLGNKEECLKILKVCGEIFSNEYHTHDFDEIIDDKDFDEIQEDLLKIIADIEE